MKCDKCQAEDSRGKYRFMQGHGFLCANCESSVFVPTSKMFVPLVIETMNLKGYGNVSRARIASVKSRRLCPDGNRGEVIFTKNGKYTDRQCVNY